MSAEHGNDSTACACRAGHGVGDRAEVPRYENVGKGVKKGGERPIRAGGTRELVG